MYICIYFVSVSVSLSVFAYICIRICIHICICIPMWRDRGSEFKPDTSHFFLIKTASPLLNTIAVFDIVILHNTQTIASGTWTPLETAIALQSLILPSQGGAYNPQPHPNYSNWNRELFPACSNPYYPEPLMPMSLITQSPPHFPSPLPQVSPGSALWKDSCILITANLITPAPPDGHVTPHPPLFPLFTPISPPLPPVGCSHYHKHLVKRLLRIIGAELIAPTTESKRTSDLIFRFWLM